MSGAFSLIPVSENYVKMMRLESFFEAKLNELVKSFVIGSKGAKRSLTKMLQNEFTILKIKYIPKLLIKNNLI